MAIWAIADLHLSRHDPESGQATKPMDIFGAGWSNHARRLEIGWLECVAAEDTVIVAGDIDWGLHLEDARETLERLDSWPGTKVLLRGNHDYWWSSKTTNRVRRALPPSLHALHNGALQAEGFNICGTKGSPVPGGIDWTAQDTKILNREEQRLLLSLDAGDPSLPTIVALHYPPFYPAHDGSPYRTILAEHGVSCAAYGHLHGEAAAAGPRGRWDGVEYRLVAADAVAFRPVLIAEGGRLATANAVCAREGGRAE